MSCKTVDSLRYKESDVCSSAQVESGNLAAAETIPILKTEIDHKLQEFLNWDRNEYFLPAISPPPRTCFFTHEKCPTFYISVKISVMRPL